MVPGTGNTDSVFANLMPGDFVINKGATKNLLGLNRGGLVPGFVDGGRLTPDIASLFDDLVRGLESAGASTAEIVRQRV